MFYQHVQIMFFTYIYQMMTESVDLTLVMHKTENGRMTVSLIPKVQTLKESTWNRFVPLVLSGTPAELDAGFFPAVAQPVQRAAGLMLNLAEFEKQAEKAAASNKTPKQAAKEKEPKEARERSEKYDKYIKRAEEQMASNNFGDAIISFQQARLYAAEEQTQNIDTRIAAAKSAQKRSSLFDLSNIPAPSPAAIGHGAQQAQQPIPQPAPADLSVQTAVQPLMPQQGQYVLPRHAAHNPPVGCEQQPLPPMSQHGLPYTWPEACGNPDTPPTYRPDEYAQYPDFPQDMIASAQ